IKEAVGSIRHNGLMSLASVSTVALTLLILGMFLVMVLNLNHMAAALESQVQISVYLQDNLSEQEIAAVKQKISQLPGLKKIEYVSKDQALQRFREQLGEQQTILNDLGEENPLPNGFDVIVEHPDQVREVAQAVSNIKGVEKLRYEKEIVERLFTITRMIRTVGLIIIVFLALAAMFIISNTIRLTVFARRREIGIMKYVGATDWFIRWPFLLEGVMLGFLGAFIAVLLLTKFYSVFIGYVTESIAFMPILPSYPIVIYLGVFLLGVGMTIGALGSTISLRRFLHV
ncbi:MAG: permease-like cell division protein FtsX, partial [Bacillota bacterium]